MLYNNNVSAYRKPVRWLRRVDFDDRLAHNNLGGCK